MSRGSGKFQSLCFRQGQVSLECCRLPHLGYMFIMDESLTFLSGLAVPILYCIIYLLPFQSLLKIVLTLLSFCTIPTFWNHRF